MNMCVACGAENPSLTDKCQRRNYYRPHDVRAFDTATRTFGERLNNQHHMTARQIEDEAMAIVTAGEKPTLPQVKRLVEAFYCLDGCGAGGPLHVVLDDGNWERHNVQWCHDNAWQYADSVEVAATSRALACVLLLLSNSQRRKL